MKKITLKQGEKLIIASIIDKYQKLEENLTTVQTQLEELDKRRADLISTLDIIRNEEVSFFKKMKKTYGEGKLDITTMDYIVTK